MGRTKNPNRPAKKLNLVSCPPPPPFKKNSPALPAAFRNQILTGGRGGAVSSRFGGGRGGAATSSSGSGGTPAPVRLLGGASFLHLRVGDVHVLAVTRDNVNAMLAFSFMVKVRVIFSLGEEEKRREERYRKKEGEKLST